MKTDRLTWFAFSVLVLSATGLCIAQSIDIEPDNETHRVRIVNELGHSIRVKVMGYRRDAHFVADLRDEEFVRERFYAGERVVCVWNRERELEIAASVDFDSDGTLRLRRTDHYGADAVRSALPEMSIE